MVYAGIPIFLGDARAIRKASLLDLVSSRRPRVSRRDDRNGFPSRDTDIISSCEKASAPYNDSLRCGN